MNRLCITNKNEFNDMEKTENRIPEIKTSAVLCTKVEDISTVQLFHSLVPKKHIEDTLDEAKEILENGDLYIELFDGKVSSSRRKEDIEIDRGCFKGDTPIMMFKHLYVDNLTFAIILQYAFSFNP